MDPKANMEEQARIRAKMRAGDKSADLDRLRELEDALREWIRNGGFIPE